MIKFDDPEIQTIEQPYYDYKDEVFLNKTAKPIITIWAGSRGGSSDNPLDTVELDWESRKYVHFRINKITKKYD